MFAAQFEYKRFDCRRDSERESDQEGFGTPVLRDRAVEKKTTLFLR